MVWTCNYMSLIAESCLQNSIECARYMASSFSGWNGYLKPYVLIFFDGLVQERRNSSALAKELRLSCTNPSILCMNNLNFRYESWLFSMSEYHKCLIYLHLIRQNYHSLYMFYTDEGSPFSMEIFGRFLFKFGLWIKFRLRVEQRPGCIIAHWNAY